MRLCRRIQSGERERKRERMGFLSKCKASGLNFGFAQMIKWRDWHQGIIPVFCYKLKAATRSFNSVDSGAPCGQMA